VILPSAQSALQGLADALHFLASNRPGMCSSMGRYLKKGANGIDSYWLCKTPRRMNGKNRKVNCKECKFSANSNVSQLIETLLPYIPRLKSLGKEKMSRNTQKYLSVHHACSRLPSVSPAPAPSPPGASGRRPAESQRNSISLDATSITGEAQDNTSYKVEKASSQKYTAPLVDTPRSVTVIPQQVLKDTAATLQDACAPCRASPSVPVKAATHKATARSSVVSTPRRHYLDGVRDTGARAARSSPSNRSKSARPELGHRRARRGRRQPSTW
jgi:hypothetical protein